MNNPVDKCTRAQTETSVYYDRRSYWRCKKSFQLVSEEAKFNFVVRKWRKSVLGATQMDINNNVQMAKIEERTDFSSSARSVRLVPLK